VSAVGYTLQLNLRDPSTGGVTRTVELTFPASAEALADPKLVSAYRQALAHLRLDAEALMQAFELAQSEAVDLDEANLRATRLQKLGAEPVEHDDQKGARWALAQALAVVGDALKRCGLWQRDPDDDDPDLEPKTEIPPHAH
jgi:hypothetical protein